MTRIKMFFFVVLILPFTPKKWTNCQTHTHTWDGVLITVTLTDAYQEAATFVLGSQQQLLGFGAVDVTVVPPAHTPYTPTLVPTTDLTSRNHLQKWHVFTQLVPLHSLLSSNPQWWEELIWGVRRLHINWNKLQMGISPLWNKRFLIFSYLKEMRFSKTYTQNNVNTKLVGTVQHGGCGIICF